MNWIMKDIKQTWYAGAEAAHLLRAFCGNHSASYHFIFLYFSIFSFFTLSSCSSSTPSPKVAEPVVVGFAASIAEAEDEGYQGRTRAAGDGELTTDLLQKKGFGVYCWYTGSQSVVFQSDNATPAAHISTYTNTLLMRNQKVEYDDEAHVWGYSPAKYWPMDPNEKLTFRAYAPYTNYLVTDEKGMPQLPVVLDENDYHNGTQHDPLWGTGANVITHNTNPYLPDDATYGSLYNNYTYPMSGDDLTADAHDGIIHWFFHHGMAKLMFACSVIQDPGCDKITITGISITPLYDHGLLNLSSPTASASDKPYWAETTGNMTVTLTEGSPNTTAGDLAPIPTLDPDPIDPYPFVIKTKTDGPTDYFNLLNEGLLIIPRDYRSPATPMEVTVTYTIDSDTTPLTAKGTISTTEFKGNTAYTLNLSLTPSTSGMEITLVQSAFTPWVEGGSGDHWVHNW